MKQSNKLITTTTQLVQPSKINAMLRGIAPNFVIKTYGGGTTQLTL
ncbi:MAG: hypothetical protein LBP53_08510 [Candidatus Peribacteria bacterium]|jgi:hypothetical protein|nr:hypothetical protein [Candidatus Peribacteria bacterium]